MSMLTPSIKIQMAIAYQTAPKIVKNAVKTSYQTLPVFFIILIVVVSMFTRGALMIKSADNADYSLYNIFRILGIGLFYDVVNAFYFIIPIMLIWLLTPVNLWSRRGYRWFVNGFVYFLVFLLLLNAVSEWIFWDEFSSRFNFIAVDYLVYTQEVLGNIQQSYPVELIIGALLSTAALLTWAVLSGISHFNIRPLKFKHRLQVTGAFLIVLCLAYLFVDHDIKEFSPNNYDNELAGNGMYELFAAYRNNELNYDQFYPTLVDDKAFAELRTLVKTPESHFVDSNTASIRRDIVNAGPEIHKNVVLISVESLSADFLGSFGNKQGITPFLDSLAAKSLLFTNLYATGTRTVRGLEALSIGTPPTPGQSIVRRPKNEGLFSMGTVFNQKGYQSRFLYGGYGYFDNMGYFFGHNDYKVVDRTAIKKEDIDYENIWGVADENLFELAVRQLDKETASGKPVFTHIMTTSNHRPYTYPDGRIDIPSHTSREGAVKYTDYAIGRFIESVRKKPWFGNTVFVIVADHCASSAGKTDLPVNRYKIPLLIYAPGFIKPGVMPRLMSQIDIGPTILGLLNFSYQSKFFGYDMFKLEPGRERAFISTYQSLGFLRHDSLVILKPQKFAGTFVPDFQDGYARPVSVNKKLTEESIAWYQCASFQFRNGMMKK